MKKTFTSHEETLTNKLTNKQLHKALSHSQFLIR